MGVLMTITFYFNLVLGSEKLFITCNFTQKFSTSNKQLKYHDLVFVQKMKYWATSFLLNNNFAISLRGFKLRPKNYFLIFGPRTWVNNPLQKNLQIPPPAPKIKYFFEEISILSSFYKAEPFEMKPLFIAFYIMHNLNMFLKDWFLWLCSQF